MSKIIIENKSNLPDTDAVDLALRVMKGGRVSNFGKQYCYLTVVYNWQGLGGEYQVASFLNKKSDRFVIQ
jgi:hypothetical protein